jgi:hypothetical protein
VAAVEKINSTDRAVAWTLISRIPLALKLFEKLLGYQTPVIKACRKHKMKRLLALVGICLVSSVISAQDAGREQSVLIAKVQNCELNYRIYPNAASLYQNCIIPAITAFLDTLGADAALTGEAQSFLNSQAALLDSGDVSVTENAQAVNRYTRNLATILGNQADFGLLSGEEMSFAMTATGNGGQAAEDDTADDVGETDRQNVTAESTSATLFDPKTFFKTTDSVHRVSRPRVPEHFTLSILIAGLDIHHVNPQTLDAYANEGGAFLNYASEEEFRSAITREIERDINEWAFLEDYDLIDVLSADDFDESVILDFTAIAKTVKSGAILSRTDYSLEDASASALQDLYSDFLLVLHVDHINIERWLVANEENYLEIYQNPQPLPSTTTAGLATRVAGTALHLVNPLAGLAGSVVGEMVGGQVDSAQNSDLIFHHKNYVSGFLVRNSDATTLWAAKMRYFSTLTQQRRIAPSFFLSEKQPFRR